MGDRKITIAIDGYSSCGKSTIARAIASRLSYSYVDTGAMYRSVTLYALRNGLINGKTLDVEGLVDQLDAIHIEFTFNPEARVSETFLNGENVELLIRQMDVNDWVSQVSAVAEVRAKMVRLQQKMGQGKGIAMDGRDIGTDVFPDAELKIFMTADPDVRAKRRYDELESKQIPASLADIKTNLMARDYEDTTRKESPLRKAPDAITLDNTNLTREQQLEYVYELAMALITKRKLPVADGLN